jgi:hypothetical protein
VWSPDFSRWAKNHVSATPSLEKRFSLVHSILSMKLLPDKAPDIREIGSAGSSEGRRRYDHMSRRRFGAMVTVGALTAAVAASIATPAQAAACP